MKRNILNKAHRLLSTQWRVWYISGSCNGYGGYAKFRNLRDVYASEEDSRDTARCYQENARGPK